MLHKVAYAVKEANKPVQQRQQHAVPAKMYAAIVSQNANSYRTGSQYLSEVESSTHSFLARKIHTFPGDNWLQIKCLHNLNMWRT